MKNRLKIPRKGRARDWSVFERVISLPMLKKGFEKVAANGGCAGGDGVDIATFSFGLDFRLKNLTYSLETREYQPGPVARFDIPKPGKAETRTLLVPSIRDRVVQTAAHLVLQPIFEPEFEEHSYGDRPGRSVPQAIRVIRDYHRQGFTHVVDADILAYFDNVPHLDMLATLADYIPEKAFLDLVEKWLYAAAGRGKGLPQGAPVSPLLANLYLDSVDEAIADAGFRMVRYADDFVILCKTRKRAEKALALVADKLAALHLELHPEKTAIRVLDEGYMFLGTKIRGTGLAEQVDALADLPPQTEATAPVASGRLRGQLGTPPSRRLGDREIEPQKGAPVLADAADTPWQAEDIQMYMSETDGELEPPEPAAEDTARLAPFIRPLYMLRSGRELRPYGIGFGVFEGEDLLAVIAAGTIDRIDIFPGASIDSEAIRRAAGLRIPVYFVDGRGRIESSLAPERPTRARLHLAQARHSLEPNLAIDLSCRFVAGRIFNARRLLQQLRQRLPREKRDAMPELEEVIESLDHRYNCARDYPKFESLNQVRGVEASAAKLYWPALSSLVKRGFGDVRFTRTRLPARTAFNAVLNYTAYLLRRDIETLILRRGIHAGFGVLHRPHRARHGCVFDIMEEFRAPVAEALAASVLSTGELGPRHFADLEINGVKQVRIVEGGAGKIIRAFERHVDHEIKHPEGGKTSWRGAMDYQITRYIRHVQDEMVYEPYLKGL